MFASLRVLFRKRRRFIIGAVAVGLPAVGYFAWLYWNSREPCLFDSSDRILRFGTPALGQSVIVRDNYVSCYDFSRRIPVWVAEHIGQDHITGTASRKTSKFQPDPTVPEKFSAINQDYWKSGWSRGHMAPAGNNKHSQKAMDETFYLTNVLPQDMDNNSGYWNLIEMFVRDLVKKYENVYVISGPLFLPSLVENDKFFVKYEVIGSNFVAVPTHLFKIVVVETAEGGEMASAAFIVPNEPIPLDSPLIGYQSSLDTVEKYCGHQFLPKLQRNILKNLCEVENCKLMDKDKFYAKNLSRKIEGARSLEYLKKVWETEVKEKGLQQNVELMRLYEAKLVELQDSVKPSVGLSRLRKTV